MGRLRVAWEDLGALERAIVKNIHAIALVTFANDNIAIIHAHLLYGIKHNIELFLIESIEHESL